MDNPVGDLSQAIYWRRTGVHMSNLDATARISDYIRTVQALAEPLTTAQVEYLHGVVDGAAC